MRLFLFVLFGIVLCSDVSDCVSADIACLYQSIYIIVTVLFLYIYRRRNLFCFELFFAVVYYLMMFYLSQILYHTDNVYMERLFGVSEMLHLKGLKLCMLGYLAFLFGASLFQPRKISGNFRTLEQLYKYVGVGKFVNKLTFVFVVTFLLSGGYKIMFQYDVQNTIRWGSPLAQGIFSYTLILIQVSSVLEFLRLHRLGCTKEDFVFKINRLYFFNCVVFGSFILFSGFRSYALLVLIPFVCLFSLFIKQITSKNLLIMSVSAFVILVVIGMARSMSNGVLDVENIMQAKEEMSLYYLTRDYASANASVYYLINYAGIHGVTGGTNALNQIVSFIPFAQSFVSLFLDITPSSSVLFTEDLGNGSGLGTSIIGDLYYTWGSAGVVLGCFLLGCMVSFLYRRLFIEKRFTVWHLLCYMWLLGNSLFYVRVEYFYLVRYIGFSFIILFILRGIYLKKRQVVFSL